MESHSGVCSVQDPFGVIVDLPTNLLIGKLHTLYSQLKTTTVLNLSPLKVHSHYYNFLYPSFKLPISHEAPRSYVLNQNHPL